MKKFTLAHRILHWLIALTMIIMLVSGFLKMFWLGGNIFETLKTQNINLNDSQMMAIFFGIGGTNMKIHVFTGYILVLLYIIRMIYMYSKGVRFPNPFKKETTGKLKIQGFTYVAFYLILLFQFISGLLIVFGTHGSALSEIAEKIHALNFFLFILFVVLHFAGIAIGENTNTKGIVSEMIGGDK